MHLCLSVRARRWKRSRRKRRLWRSPEASCIGCHKINNDGAEVGPNLTGIGKTPEPGKYLPESIVDRNAKIAAGFETVIADTQRMAPFTREFSRRSQKPKCPSCNPRAHWRSFARTLSKAGNAAPRHASTCGENLSKKDLRDLVEYPQFEAIPDRSRAAFI
jgi:hypothetical protein